MKIETNHGESLWIDAGNVMVWVSREPLGNSNEGRALVRVSNGRHKEQFVATFDRGGMQVISYPGKLSEAEEEALWEGPDEEAPDEQV